MPSLREYFLTESQEYLDRLDTLGGSGQPDADELLRTARALRGSAQMARADRVRRVAATLEAAAREVQSGQRGWDEDVQRRLRETVADLRTLAAAGDDAPESGSRMQTALDRWQEIGVTAPATGGVGGEPAQDELRDYVRTEVRGVVQELDRALPALARAPMGREPLKAILRRQRALLGAAGLERFSAIAEALQAVDDATRAIARRNIAVDGDWMTLYRAAHDVLAAADPDQPGVEPPALLEMRSMRSRLLGGQAEEAPQPPPAPSTGEPVEVIAFFRTESDKLLDRIERMAGAFAAATEERRTQLRGELRSALNALRDTSRTFGFEEPARAAEAALARVGDPGASALIGVVEDLRDSVAAVGEAESEATPEMKASPEPEPSAAAPAAGMAAAVPATADSPAVVPIEDLLYRGDRALERVLEMRGHLEEAVASDRDVAEALDELFDLVRLAMS